MPICSATRRASYTSSSEQQRPVAPSTERPGSRRWFQSCMVRPTTARPSRASMAATVELSTPPLMATAMGGSGMPGDPPQMLDGARERVHQRVNLAGRVGAPQRETHAGARPFRGQAHIDEHVGRRDGAAGTGGAGGDGEAAQVERDHQGFAIDSVEVHVGGIGRAARAGAVHAGARNAFEDGVFQAVAQGGETFGFGGEGSGGELGGGAEGRDAGHVLGAGPPVALVMPAEGDGGAEEHTSELQSPMYLVCRA